MKQINYFASEFDTRTISGKIMSALFQRAIDEKNESVEEVFPDLPEDPEDEDAEMGEEGPDFDAQRFEQQREEDRGI